MNISTTIITTVLSALAGVFGFIAGLAGASMTPTPTDGNGTAFLLMIFSTLIAGSLVYLVYKTVEKETTFSINFNGKA